MKALLRQLGRVAALVVLSFAALQLFFALRVASMTMVDPQSTAFQRTEAWRLLLEQHRLPWSQQWVDYERISPHLKRAVIASEDASFTEHSGVEWDAIEKAWEKNLRAQARADRINDRLEQLEARLLANGSDVKPAQRAVAKIIGGSTITQQLAKNVFLSGERTALRKLQEFVITFTLEALLDKRRILEIYLNNVEWGEGVFGAQAAARHYFKLDASQLGAYPGARLAVMLPAPKRFEKRPGSAYIVGRASTIVARMGAVDLP
jgi:monofunctional biosynthetic peptidoglycan transglycosylase